MLTGRKSWAIGAVHGWLPAIAFDVQDSLNWGVHPIASFDSEGNIVVRPRHVLTALSAAILACIVASCSVDAPSMEQIRDSKLFDRRIKETPRQKVIRECQQEGERYHVGCVFCHSTEKVDEIAAPDKLQLTPVGKRAQIMRKSPQFGLNQDCAVCHQTKFHLNRNAEKLFGPGGAKYAEAQKELKPDDGSDEKK